MALDSIPWTYHGFTRVFLRPLLMLTTLFPFMIAASGCMKTEEKNYAGAAQSEFSLNYELTMKYSGQDKVNYQLKTVPPDMTVFLTQLNKKWHEEANLKYSAYDKLKEYCDFNKDAALCIDIKELTKEVESREMALFFTLRLFDNSKKELDNISGKLSLSLNDKDNFQHDSLQVENVITMDREKFRSIGSVELQIK